MKTYRHDFAPLVAKIIASHGGGGDLPTKKARRAWRVELRRLLRAEFLRVAEAYFNNPDWKTVKRSYCYAQWTAEIAEQTGRRGAKIRKRQDERASLFLP